MIDTGDSSVDAAGVARLFASPEFKNAHLANLNQAIASNTQVRAQIRRV